MDNKDEETERERKRGELGKSMLSARLDDGDQKEYKIWFGFMAYQPL